MNVDSLDELSISFLFDFYKEKTDQLLLDLLVLHDVSLELRRLHSFDRQVVLHLGHKVLVHVEKDVFDHDNHVFLQVPHFRDFLDQILIWLIQETLANGLEHLDGSLLDVLVEHLTVLVQDHVVGSSVELLVGELGCFLLVNLLDGILDDVPVTESLISVQGVVSHAIIFVRPLLPQHFYFLIGYLN